MDKDELTRLIEGARERFGLVGDYEIEQLARLESVLRGAARFVDVGANRGVYAYVANHLMRNGRIVMIEADPRLAGRLRQEAQAWLQETDNGNEITVLATAAGDEDRQMPFRIGPAETLGSLTDSDFLTEATETIEVPVRALDALLEPAPRTVFKIDVEGFEYRVLLGARRHLAMPDARLVIELHGWGDASIGRYPPDVFALMRRAGFSAERTGGRDYIFLFRRDGARGRWTSFLRCAPMAHAKALARRAGLRPLWTAMRMRLGLGHGPGRSGLR